MEISASGIPSTLSAQNASKKPKSSVMMNNLDIFSNTGPMKDILVSCDETEAIEILEDSIIRCWVCNRKIKFKEENRRVVGGNLILTGQIVGGEKFVIPSIGLEGFLCYPCIQKQPNLEHEYNTSGNLLILKQNDIERLAYRIDLCFQLVETMKNYKHFTTVLSTRLRHMRKVARKVDHSIYHILKPLDSVSVFKEIRFCINELKSIAKTEGFLWPPKEVSINLDED